MATTQPSIATTTAGTGTTATAQTAPLVADAPHGSLAVQAVTKVFVAPDSGGQITGDDDRNVLVGGHGNDIINGGKGEDLIVGGGGTNVLTGGADTDVFGHLAGAQDLITDFAPSSDEKLVLEPGLTLANSHSGAVDVPSLGLVNSQAMILTFSDNSTVALVGVTETPQSSWFA